MCAVIKRVEAGHGTVNGDKQRKCGRGGSFGGKERQTAEEMKVGPGK